jgi:hypothetical protein
MGVIIIHCMTPWRYVEFMVVPDGRMTLCRPRRRHAGDGLERMRVRYWKANRSVERVEEVVEVRANGPLERTAHRRSPAGRRARRPRPPAAGGGAPPPPARGGQLGPARAGRPAGRARGAAPGCTFLPRPRDARAARPAAPRPREPAASAGSRTPGTITRHVKRPATQKRSRSITVS